MADAATEPEVQEGASAAETQGDAVEVRDAELTEADETTVPSSAPGQIDILLDSHLSVSATLGQAQVLVRDLLQLGPGSVIKLDRAVGEPIDLYLRGIHFATGQLVVVGEHLAVRIKEILSPQAAEAVDST